MLDFLGSLLRLFLFFCLGLFSLIVASVFIVATLITLGVLVLIAKLRGKDFQAKQYWQQKRQTYTWNFRTGGFQRHQESDDASHNDTIIDVEVTEVNSKDKQQLPY